MLTQRKKQVLISALAFAVLSLPLAAMGENKLKVQDGSSNDKFVVTDTGAVGAGTSAPAGQLEVANGWSAKATTNILSVFTSYGDAARLTVRAAEGTLAAPTKTLSNTTIGNLNFRGFDGTSFSSNGVAVIAAAAEADFTPTVQPTRLQFQTTSSAGATTEKLRIASDGRLRLSNQPAAPANNATCTVGDLILDAANGYLYLCIATNSWRRTAFVSY